MLPHFCNLLRRHWCRFPCVVVRRFVLRMTQTGTRRFCLPALRRRRFFAVGLFRAMDPTRSISLQRWCSRLGLGPSGMSALVQKLLPLGADDPATIQLNLLEVPITIVDFDDLGMNLRDQACILQFFCNALRTTLREPEAAAFGQTPRFCVEPNA